MITLRYARKSDVEPLLEMWVALHDFHVKKLGRSKQYDWVAHCRAIERRYFLSKVIPKRNLIVAQYGQQLIGYCEYSTKSKPAIYRVRKYLSIDSIYIRSDYRRMGVGERLIEQITKIARERRLSSIALIADIKNVAGHKFYQQQGFEKSWVILSKRLK